MLSGGRVFQTSEVDKGSGVVGLFELLAICKTRRG